MREFVLARTTQLTSAPDQAGLCYHVVSSEWFSNWRKHVGMPDSIYSEAPLKPNEAQPQLKQKKKKKKQKKEEVKQSEPQPSPGPINNEKQLERLCDR